jgi:spore maturation protein CgeB
MGLTVGVVGPCDVDDLAWHLLETVTALGMKPVALGSADLRDFPGPLAKPVSVAHGLIRQHAVHGWRAESRIVSTSVTESVDLVITGQSLHPETVRRLRARGIPAVLWFPDHVANLGPLWMFDAPYERVFFKEPHLVNRIRSTLDLPVSLLHEACNPSVHRPPAQSAKRATVGVVGNLYATRVQLLRRLADDGYQLEIYGTPLPLWSSLRPDTRLATRGYVRGDAKAAAYRNCGVILNSMHPAEIDGMNCRLFEAAGCGAAVVTEERASLGALFDTGSEVRTFGSYPALRSVLDELLGDPSSALQLGDRAALRARSEHTYEARLRTLFAEIGVAIDRECTQ